MLQLSLAILGAALALCGGAALRWWQYNRDAWLSQIKECDELIHKSAESSCEYWLDDSNNGTPQIPTNPARIKSEAEILAAQIRISGHLELLSDRLSQQDILSIEGQCTTFFQALTGGNFMSKRDAIEPDRARDVFVSAADLSIEIKRCARRALSTSGTASYLAQRWKKRWARNKM